jgi:hypothetical protein
MTASLHCDTSARGVECLQQESRRMWRMLSQCLRCHVVTLAAENIKWLNLEYLAYADIAGNRGDQQHHAEG